MIEVKDSEEKDFQIDYKYCNNAYVVADERCIEVPWMLKNIKNSKKKQMKILDVGCVESRYLDDLNSIGCDVYGNDTRDVGDNTTFKGFFKGRIQEIETEIRFDAITCISVLEHIGLGGYGSRRERLGAMIKSLIHFGDFKKAQILALKNMSRLLNNEGLIYLSVPYGKRFIYYGGKRNPLLLRHLYAQPVPFAEYDSNLLRSIIDKSGLSIFKEGYYCWIREKWQKVKSDFLKNVKYGDFGACNATGIALLVLRKSDK